MAEIFASEAGGIHAIEGRNRRTLTLQKAIDKAKPGDVITLAEDTYLTRCEIRDKQATKAKPITIRAVTKPKRTSFGPVPSAPGFFGAFRQGATYDGPFSNPVVADGRKTPDFGGRLYRMSEADYAFFQIINSDWIVIEGLEFKNCWPACVYLSSSRNITFRDIPARHGKYFVYAADKHEGEAQNIVLDRVRWVQDPDMDMWTGRATWKDVKGQSYVDKMYYGGAILGGHNVAGDVVIRNCHVSHAFNGVRLAMTDDGEKTPERYNNNVLIIDSHFDHIRDNAVEPEYGLRNWFVIDCSFYNNHAAFSFDTVSGEGLYMLGNRVLNYRRPGQPGDKNVGGRLYKFANSAKNDIRNFVTAHNATLTRTKYVKKGKLSNWLHINNAISILRSGIDANPDRTLFHPKFKWSKKVKFLHEICNLPEFPDQLQADGAKVDGILANEIDGTREIFQPPVSAETSNPIPREAKDGIAEWDGALTLRPGCGGEKASLPFTLTMPGGEDITIPGGRDLGGPCPPEARAAIEALFDWAPQSVAS